MRILITAGPTRERLDPVRFISNYSTGTFGYNIANSALKRGHKAILVSGPVAIKPSRGVKLIKIESALDMQKAIRKEFESADCLIMAAAVSDWRPARRSGFKIKKGEGRVKFDLKENPDILKNLSKKAKGKILVGFALETGSLGRNALKKLREKRLDIVVANAITPRSGAFGSGKTDVLIMDKFGNRSFFRRKTKKELAEIILDKAEEFNI